MNRERMSSVDTAWLRMDSPQNLMTIVGVWVFEHPVDLDALRDVVTERFVKIRRFHQRVESDATGFWWVDDGDFEIDRHFVVGQLPRDGGDRALQAEVARLASTPLDRRHPLWQFHLLRGYRGTDALVARIHHCIADGIALVGVMLSLTDHGEPAAHADPGAAHEDDDHHSNPWEGLLQPLTRGAVQAINATGTVFEKSVRMLAEPDRLVEYAQFGAQVARDIAHMALLPNDTRTRLKGRPGTRKAVAWNDPLPLDEVKAVAKALGVSINDVLLACVAGSLRGYLRAHGEGQAGTEIRAMVPVNLRPIERALELGNKFGLVPLELPVGIENPVARVLEVKRRMNELKHGYQAVLAFLLLGAVGVMPRAVQKQVLDLFGRKTTAVMSNVPGPRSRIRLAGVPIERLLVWVPQTGDVGVGVSILSYNGGVQFGVITDTLLCDEPERIIAGFQPEFDKLVMTLAMLPESMYGGGRLDPVAVESMLLSMSGSTRRRTRRASSGSAARQTSRRSTRRPPAA